MNTMKVGDTISVPKAGGLVRHRAVYVGPRGPEGEDVVDNSPGHGARLAHLDKVAAGRPVEVEPPAQDNPNEREVIVRRALSQIGKPYRVLSRNCEDVANYAKTGKAFSPQRDAILGLACVTGMILALTYGSRRQFRSPRA